jgi:aminopeptidase N
VQVDWPSGAGYGGVDYRGMEHHPFWHISYGSLSDPNANAHEAAHGWFGDGVRLGCWEDLVLSEGTVTYLAAIAAEETNDPYAAYVWQNYDYLLSLVPAKSAWPSTCGQIDVLRDLYGLGPYMKGAYFYRALEKRLSRVQVVGALRHVYQRFQGKTAVMQDVLDQVRTDTGYDPTTCANAWLRSTTVPSSSTCP